MNNSIDYIKLLVVEECIEINGVNPITMFENGRYLINSEEKINIV